jgi:hypothetical protein
MMRKAGALLLALAGGGCAIPQTTEELRDVYKTSLSRPPRRRR